MTFEAADPGFAERVRASFAAQRLMSLYGAALERVEPGAVDIGLAHRPELTQQHGYLHAGVLAAIADSACGYAAYTLMPEGSNVLSIEFKVNLLRPAAGARFVAEGRVIRSGRTITATRADVLAFGAGDVESGGAGKLVATMLGTMIRQ